MTRTDRDMADLLFRRANGDLHGLSDGRYSTHRM
jgi:hypothetical protein